MIPKSELVNKINILESKLQRILFYHPELEDIQQFEETLSIMGLSSDEISGLFSNGRIYKYDVLTDPNTGNDVLIHSVCVTIQYNRSSGKYEIYLNNQPYNEYIASCKYKSQILEKLSKEYVEVKDLLRENEKLKEMLSHLL